MRPIRNYSNPEDRKHGVLRSGEPQPERYFFSWAGRNGAMWAKDSPPKGFLASYPEDSIDFEKTKNIFVEGDNLEVLKIFQSSLRNRVKMIYIDPPYNANSGQQLYEDDFRDSLGKYLSTTGKSVKKPGRAHKNLETSGRLHSRWLTMIYPRIFLAKNLLQEDGVMFVSIDDTEVHNLRMIMNEIFGEENVEVMIWKKVDSNEGKLKLIKRFRIEHEYILVGYKNKEKCFFKKVSELPRFKNPTENVDDDPRGDWVSGNMSSTEAISVKGGKNYYQVTSPGGRKFSRQWKFPRVEFNRLNQDNRIYWGKNGNNVPRLKVFSNEPRLVYVSSVVEDKGTAKSASTEISRLVEDDTFPNPKPVKLIQYLIDAAQTQNGIIMDFFAGSGTTAHAVLAQNALDGANRSFVLVQSSEVIDSKLSGGSGSHHHNIADITKARIVAVIRSIEKSERMENKSLDLGMKVLRLHPL